MLKFSDTNGFVGVIAAAVLFVCTNTTLAQSAELKSGVSCVEGLIAAHEYAELGQDFEESFGDNMRVVLSDDEAALSLDILDGAGNSVCQEDGDVRKQCTFHPRTAGDLTVKIDNTGRSTEAHYRICAG